MMLAAPNTGLERLGLRYETLFGEGPLLEILGAEIHR